MADNGFRDRPVRPLRHLSCLIGKDIELLKDQKDKIYLDLERSSDVNKLQEPEWFLGSQQDKLICLDEIQRKPDLFPVLRSLIDQSRRNGMYIVLGSASPDLLLQSSESLAGRISYKQLSPFLWPEIFDFISLETYLTRGGFPLSLLSNADKVSYEWRQDFITTFLERYLMQFSGFVPITMRRLWQMLAHNNGQTINYSSLASSLGECHTTIKNYVDLLEGAFMLYQLKPYAENIKKRLVKSPKIYLTDTGIVTALLQLKNFEQAAGHPGFGSLWETLVINNLQHLFKDMEYSFYRTNHGHEIDMIMSYGTKRVAIECKASLTPQLTRKNYGALEDINPISTYIVIPAQEVSYSLRKGIHVVSLDVLIELLKNIFN